MSFAVMLTGLDASSKQDHSVRSVRGRSVKAVVHILLCDALHSRAFDFEAPEAPFLWISSYVAAPRNYVSRYLKNHRIQAICGPKES